MSVFILRSQVEFRKNEEVKELLKKMGAEKARKEVLAEELRQIFRNPDGVLF